MQGNFLLKNPPSFRQGIADHGTGCRRTGVTLKEGKRDEHGMEEIDGIFSSPEKSPAGEHGFGNITTIGSDGMSIDEGV
jgi:centromere protein C